MGNFLVWQCVLLPRVATSHSRNLELTAPSVEVE
jgi:hypothetical protein